MSVQTKTHGDLLPVFQIDRLGKLNSSGSPINETAVAVQIAGPKLDFFGMDLGGDPSGQMGTGGAIEAVVQTITQLATVHFYQVQASASANNFSIAVYPTGAWAAADLQTAIRALGTVNGYDLSGAAVTNNGFKLA
jgi:hypothetical protein